MKTSNNVSKTTEIRINVPLTNEAKGTLSIKMLDALDQIELAEIGKKEYPKERKEEIQNYQRRITERRRRIKETQSNNVRVELMDEMLSAMNSLRDIENEIETYKARMDLSIAECQAIVDSCRIDLTTGKTMKWIEVTMIKDYDKKVKSYFSKDKGELVRTVPMNEDDLQLGLEE